MRPAIRIDNKPKQNGGKKANPLIVRNIEYVQKRLRQNWDWESIARDIGVTRLELYRYCYYRNIY